MGTGGWWHETERAPIHVVKKSLKYIRIVTFLSESEGGRNWAVTRNKLAHKITCLRSENVFVHIKVLISNLQDKFSVCS